MIDNLFNLEDFQKIFKGNKEDIRVTLRQTQLSELTLEVAIIVSAPMKDRLLRCEVGRQRFITPFLNIKDSDEAKKYREFVDGNLTKVKTTLGFEPIEGIWE